MRSALDHLRRYRELLVARSRLGPAHSIEDIGAIYGNVIRTFVSSTASAIDLNDGNTKKLTTSAYNQYSETLTRLSTMLTDQPVPRKFDVILGESVFYHSKYGINYSLAHELKLNSRLQETCTFRYVYEPSLLPGETTDLKRQRYDKLLMFGVPMQLMEPTSIREIVKSSDFVIAPYLFDQAKAQKFSPKDLLRTVWVLLDVPPVDGDDFSFAFRDLEETVYKKTNS